MSDQTLETPDSFLETDELLQALVIELERYKSTSEQLTLTRENVDDLLNSCNRLVTLCGQLAERNKEQLDATTKFAHDTERHTNLVLDVQQTSAALTEERFNALVATLANHEKSIGNVVDITERRTTLLMDAQLASATLTEERFNALVAALAIQEKSISDMINIQVTGGEQIKVIEKILQTEVGPPLQRVQSIASGTRLITLILLALLLINGGLAAYIVRLLSS